MDSLYNKEHVDCFVGFKRQVHRTAVAVQSSMETPALILKVMRTSAAVFSYIPGCQESLDDAKKALKTCKSGMKVIKGVKSVDGLLRDSASRIDLVIHLLGCFILALNALILAEKCNRIDLTTLRIWLQEIPWFGDLPLAGLQHFPCIGEQLLCLSQKSTKEVSQDNQRSKLNKQISLVKNILFVGSVLSKYGLREMPVFILALDFISTGLSLDKFFKKRQIALKKTEPVNITNYQK
jgi:hypothetical protein